MAALHGIDILDAEYTKEVIHCLSQSIVQLLQTRPRDPIAYLAQCLHSYRRNHPREPTQRSEHCFTADPVKFHDDSSKSFSQPKNEQGNTKISGTTTASPTNMVHRQHTVAMLNVEEDIEMSLVHNRFSYVDFVHREFNSLMLTHGDLFDDDDFG